MLATRGVAVADHLHTVFGMKDRIGPPVLGNISALGREKFGRGLGATGDKAKHQNKGKRFHVASLAPPWLRQG